MAIIIYAYISAVMFVAGTAYVLVKWIFNRKGPTDTYLGLPFLFTYPGQETRWQAFVNILKRIFLFSSAKYDRPLRYTSLAFHWSLWIVLVAHLDIVLSPYITGAGVSEATLEIAGAYIGTAFAVIMTAFGAFLLSRRFYDKYMKRLSSLPDYFSIVLILAIGVAGIYMRVALPPAFAYSAVTPFIYSLLSFSPVNVPMEAPFVIHFLLASTLLLYFPFSKLMHPYSFFTNPTLYTIHHGDEVK